jgi:hypothetical protein
MGYEAYLHAARLALLWLRLGPDRPPQPTVEQKQHTFGCAMTAFELMSAPRLHEHVSLTAEALLVEEVGFVLKEVLSRNRRSALRAALNNLQANGSITNRRMNDQAKAATRGFENIKAKAQAEQEAPERQSCAHCSARAVHVAQFKRCAACKAVVFCSKDCQLANWPAHKAACKAARKAAAAGVAADDA